MCELSVGSHEPARYRGIIVHILAGWDLTLVTKLYTHAYNSRYISNSY